MTTTATLSLADKTTRQETIKNFLDSKLDALITKAEDHETLSWWRSILTLAGSFHRYSFGNLCLIQAQIQNPSFVAGANTWIKKYGRIVAKGQRAAWILAPMIVKKEDKAGERKDVMIGFRSVPVFDFSQTVPLEEGQGFQDPNSLLKATGDASKLLPMLEAFVTSKGWTLEYVDSISGGGGSARGCSFGGKIHVKASLDSADRAKVLAHEIGHELLHWVDGSLDPNHSRSWRETEAESTAYAICSAYGIEANSELYLNSFGATRAMVKESTSRIFRAVKEVLTFTQGTTETQEEA